MYNKHDLQDPEHCIYLDIEGCGIRKSVSESNTQS
jgi:hypothetical protein